MKVLWVAGVFLLVTPSLADEVSHVAAKVQERYEKISDLKAKFTQTVTYRSIGKSQTDEGIVKFKKPDRMKWEYLSPGKQIIVCDGKKIWFYLPEDAQVMTADIKAAFSAETPSNFLSGMGKLTEEFNVQLKREDKALFCLNLLPRKPIENLKELVICVDRKDYLVRESHLIDNMGNETVVRFRDIEVNTGLKDSEFEFKVPEGVEVIETRPAKER